MCKKMTGVGLAVSCAIGILLLFQMGLAASRSDQQKQANADLSLLEITSEKITIEFIHQTAQAEHLRWSFTSLTASPSQ